MAKMQNSLARTHTHIGTQARTHGRTDARRLIGVSDIYWSIYIEISGWSMHKHFRYSNTPIFVRMLCCSCQHQRQSASIDIKQLQPTQGARGGDRLRKQARRSQRGNPALAALRRAGENGLSPPVSGEQQQQQQKQQPLTMFYLLARRPRTKQTIIQNTRTFTCACDTKY